MAGLALLMTIAPAGSAITIVNEDEAHVECIPGWESIEDPPPMPPYSFTATGICTSELTPPSVGPVDAECVTGDTTGCVTGLITFMASDDNFDGGAGCGFTPFNCIEADASARGDPQFCHSVKVWDNKYDWGFQALDCPVWLEASATATGWLAPGTLTLEDLVTGDSETCDWTLENGCEVDLPRLEFIDIGERINFDGSGVDDEDTVRVVSCSETECIIEACEPGKYDVVGEDTLGNTVTVEPDLFVEGCYRMQATSGGITFE